MGKPAEESVLDLFMVIGEAAANRGLLPPEERDDFDAQIESARSCAAYLRRLVMKPSLKPFATDAAFDTGWGAARNGKGITDYPQGLVDTAEKSAFADGWLASRMED